MNQEAKYNQFVSLLARNDQAIRRFVRSLLPSREGVDDVVQDVALECWKKFNDFSPENPETAGDEFIRWACVIARFKVLSRIRDQSRDRLVFRENIISHLADDAINRLDQDAEERRSVEDCLQKLEEPQRRLILSVHSPDDSIAQIAKETNQKARRLYSKLNALRKTLLNCVRNNTNKEV